MKMHHKVKGITLIGFAMMLCVLGFFAYIAMRLIPVYTEYFGVLRSMEQERQDPRAPAKSLAEMRGDLSSKFNTQYVDDANVPPTAISVKREGGAMTLRIAYERRVHLMFNLDIVASFDKSVNLSGSGAE
ncbi:MAG: DUF4845 domain-containing protein [Dokdonella sp.]